MIHLYLYLKKNWWCSIVFSSISFNQWFVLYCFISSLFIIINFFLHRYTIRTCESSSLPRYMIALAYIYIYTTQGSPLGSWEEKKPASNTPRLNVCMCVYILCTPLILRKADCSDGGRGDVGRACVYVLCIVRIPRVFSS